MRVFQFTGLWLFVWLAAMPLNAVGESEQPGLAGYGGVDSKAGEGLRLRSFGNFKRMVHQRNSAGVVKLNGLVNNKGVYALGAIAGGLGEITVINGEVWLDYGSDGPGNSVHQPGAESAVLMVMATVKAWHQLELPAAMSFPELQAFVLLAAENLNLDIKKPFAFQVNGVFSRLDMHVIDGINSDFGGHGRGHLYKMHPFTRQHQPAAVIGFYSADQQGVYTHMGSSWHLHGVLADDDIGGHVESLVVEQGSLLLLPKL